MDNNIFVIRPPLNPPPPNRGLVPFHKHTMSTKANSIKRF